MKISKMILLLAMTFALSAAVMGTQFTEPLDGGVVSGAAYELNVTSGLTNVTACNVTASSALSGDTLGITELGLADKNYNFTNKTIDSTALEDAADWIFTGECVNGSDVGGSGDNVSAITSITVTVDNTNPTAPTITTPADVSQQETGIGVFSVVTVDATTTACTLYLSTGGGNTYTTYAMTESGATCTYTYSSLPPGFYRWYVIATDGTDTATSDEWTFEDKLGANGRRTVPSSSDDGTSLNPWIIGALAFGALYFYQKNKKGGKKRK